MKIINYFPIFITLLFYSHSFGSEKTTKNSAKLAINALLPSLNTSSQIKTKACQIDKQKWTNLLLTKQSFQETIKFNPQCDLEGSYSPKMDEFFLVKLKVKDQNDLSNISGDLKFSVVFEEMPILKVQIRNGQTHGKENLKFQFHYNVQINPLEKDPMQKHLGGSIKILSVNNKVKNKEFKIERDKSGQIVLK